MTQTTERPSAALAWLARNRLPAAYGLIGLGIVMLAVAGIALYQLGISRLEGPVAALLVALITLGGGLWQLLRSERPETELDLARMLVLSVGGLCGLVLTLFGAVLARKWWTTYLITWLKVGEGEDLWRWLVVLVSLIGGLGLMFVSLQLGRTEERTNPSLRRLVYGYNAVLSGLLLLAILALANVFVYLKLPQSLDFTASSLYSLSSETESLIQALDKPVQVKAVMRTSSFTPQIKDLLEGCQTLNDKFTWELLSPELNRTTVEALATQYNLEQEGLLVLYGDPDSKPEFRIIKNADLYGSSGPGEPPGQIFKGEDLLITEVRALLQGKKLIVYATQGNGELDLQDDQTRGALDNGAGALKKQLESRNFEIKPLLFSPANAKVPDDADAVLVLGPRNGLPDFALRALDSYMNPDQAGKEPGRLIVMLNIPANKDMADRQKGLHNFLSRFQVQAGSDRILGGVGYQQIGDANLVLVIAYPREDNPMLRPFRDRQLHFRNAQAFQPGAPSQHPMGARYRVIPLLVCLPGQGIFTYSDLEADPNKALADYEKDPDHPPRGLTLLPLERPPQVALAAMSIDPNDPHAGMMRGPVGGKPSLVVIGDATLVSNRSLSGPRGEVNMSLVANSLGWLRERKGGIGGVPPKQRNYYTLKSSVSLFDITVIPTVLMLVGIVGLGAGVWVVRRR